MHTEYEFALRLAFEDMGIYCAAVITPDGEEQKRTAWQDGWNAYGIDLDKKADGILKFLCSLPEEVKFQVEKLIEDDRLGISISATKGQAKLWVNCNDLFYWACTDMEDITLEELPQLEQTLKESPHGDLLWVSRKRKMRPQKPYYKCFTEDEKTLFDACGPERTD